MNHCSTVEERIQMVSQMLAHPKYGQVTQLSQTSHVARQTLYRWQAKAQQALEEALSSKVTAKQQKPEITTLVLSLLIEMHGSYREIQRFVQSQYGIGLSLGTIVSIVGEAGQRALNWMKRQQSEHGRALALDEQYSSQRGKAYLNVIDVHSGQVWASVPPIAVDGESWTLMLWMIEEQGIKRASTVSDGGHAIADALQEIGAANEHQRDVWHLFHLAAQVQGKLDRALEYEEKRLPKRRRQEEQVALGKGARGRPCTSTVAELETLVARLDYLRSGVDYLSQEIRRLLDVVVVQGQRVLLSGQRQQEIQAALDLLEEIAVLAPAALQTQIHKLAQQYRFALPELLLFARQLDTPLQAAEEALGASATALVAWAWLRRDHLASHPQELVQGFDPAWQPVVEGLLSAFARAVRASSVVENWHSIVRPHLAVHRTLSAGMLALLAVWHNHRIAPRGKHAGLSPLQRTESTDSQISWLAALGYFPLTA